MGNLQTLPSPQMLLLLKIWKHRMREECLLSTPIKLHLPEDVAVVGNFGGLLLCRFLVDFKVPGTIQHVTSFFALEKKSFMKKGRLLEFFFLILILELESEVFIFIFIFIYVGWVGGRINQWLAGRVGLGWLGWETGDWMVEGGERRERGKGGGGKRKREKGRKRREEGRASHSRPTDRCALRSSLSLLALPPPLPHPST